MERRPRRAFAGTQPLLARRAAAAAAAAAAVTARRCRRRVAPPPSPRRAATPTAAAGPPDSLSNPLPVDAFAIPHLTFINSHYAAAARPELLGTLLWSAGLYLGLSQRVRWGAALRDALAGALEERAALSRAAAAAAATALHTLPFLFAGLGADAALRAAAGGSGAWADAAGVTLVLYGGIYEAGRSSARGRALDAGEAAAFGAFAEFASRRLERRGRCHLYDVRNALAADAAARRGGVGRISDEQLRRFIRNYAPAAVRTPNGYYRRLSVVERTDTDGGP